LNRKKGLIVRGENIFPFTKKGREELFEPICGGEREPERKKKFSHLGSKGIKKIRVLLYKGERERNCAAEVNKALKEKLVKARGSKREKKNSGDHSGSGDGPIMKRADAL